MLVGWFVWGFYGVDLVWGFFSLGGVGRVLFWFVSVGFLFVLCLVWWFGFFFVCVVVL